MEKINVKVYWCEKNFSAAVGDNVPGAILVTAKTYAELQEKVRSAVEFHVEGMVEDGDDVPKWLADGEYDFEWGLEISAIIRICEQFTSLAAIARASGVNERQLSHYANGTKQPRPLQQSRILDGIHKIGSQLMAV